ncbi:TPA: hypothetical protein NJ322_005025 [Vibrio parahaemolyticus]|nr:hypothetical protein [Vibrio parahaemolyticus]HCG7105669.1 hypothetical protein [Vibrio parahaemolyticus]
MSFDARKFDKAKFEHRTKDVPVPELADFFSDDEEPIFKVRGLSHAELIEVSEIQNKDNNYRAIIEAMFGSDPLQKAKMIQEMIGCKSELPAETRARIEVLRMGCVEPQLDTQLCSKLAEFYPAQFNGLVATINGFTEQGALVAKKKR